MDAWTPARTLATALTDAGVRATTDPDDAHPPVALVTPTGVEPLPGDCGVVTLAVSIVTAGLSHSQVAWLWRDAVPVVLAVAGADRIDTTTTDDGVPVVVATVERPTD